MAQLTHSLVEFSTYLQNLLLAEAVTLGIPHGAVYYGDQTAFPYSPAITVEVDEKKSEYRTAQRGVEVTFNVYVSVYSGLIASESVNTLEADKLAEAVEDIINADPTSNGLTLDCLVTLVESGYAQRDGTIYRVSRLTVRGRSQHRLPAATWNGA